MTYLVPYFIFWVQFSLLSFKKFIWSFILIKRFKAVLPGLSNVNIVTRIKIFTANNRHKTYVFFPSLSLSFSSTFYPIHLIFIIFINCIPHLLLKPSMLEILRNSFHHSYKNARPPSTNANKLRPLISFSSSPMPTSSAVRCSASIYHYRLWSLSLSMPARLPASPPQPPPREPLLFKTIVTWDEFVIRGSWFMI